MTAFGKEFKMFHKKGTPQPIHIASGLCESCGKNPATVLHEGKMICSECKEKAAAK